MKKALLAALGVATLASVATAQTNVVLSRNAVGYVRIDLIATNKLHLLRNDFEGLNAPIAISNALASLPIGSQVILWNPASQSYLPPINKTVVGFGPGGSNRLDRARGFFVRSPNASTNTSTIPLFLMGEVPDRFTAPTTTLNAVQGLNMVGHPYPVATHWTNTALAKNLPIGSQLFIWNETNQAYNAPINRTIIGWGPVGNALIVRPGQGYFVRATNAVGYAEVKPYTWP